MVNPSKKIDETRQVAPPFPVGKRPNVSVPQVRDDRSTIGKAAGVTLPFQPSKPTLDRPIPVWEMLNQVNRLEVVANRVSLQKESSAQYILDKIQTLHIEEAKKLEEAYAASQDVTFWGMLEDVGSVVMSSVSFFFGFSALTSGGTAVGGALVVSGILSLSNVAFKHAQVWDWIADQLSNGDEETRQTILTYLPAAVGIAAAAMGAFGAYGAWNTPTVQGTEKAFAIIQTAASVASGLTAYVNGKAASHFKWAGAEVSALQSKGELTTLDLENVLEEIKGFQKKLVETQELAGKLIQDADKAVQITQQIV